jgi:sulfoxide reductase catalytic subunit YedY
MNFLRPSRYSLPGAKVTPEPIFWNRREFLRGLALAATRTALSACNSKESSEPTGTDLPPRPSDSLYPASRNDKYQAGDRTLTPAAIAGRYNNFYEFTTDKADVARLASRLTIDPWTIEIGGLVQKPFQIGFEDLVKKFPLEERIYRMRCVEAWSMVVPWVGFPFRKLVEFCQPLSSPLLLLFVVTGWWQTVSPNRNKGLGFGTSWIEKLSTIHVDNYFPLPGARNYSTDLFKVLVVIMATGLIFTTR